MFDLIPILRQEMCSAGITGELMSDPRQIHVPDTIQSVSAKKAALDLLEINKDHETMLNLLRLSYIS
jgi:hypothetical protein